MGAEVSISDLAHDPDGQVERVDHVAIAVADLTSAVGLYADVLGGQLINGGDSREEGIRTVQLGYPSGSKIELIAPLHDGSRLWSFLTRRGSGVHHITLIVPDIQATMRSVAAAGVELVDADLRSPRWREVYTRPASSNGVLIQFAETDLDWTVPRNPEISLEDVLTGRVTWQGHQCLLDG